MKDWSIEMQKHRPLVRALDKRVRPCQASQGTLPEKALKLVRLWYLLHPVQGIEQYHNSMLEWILEVEALETELRAFTRAHKAQQLESVEKVIS